MVHALSSAKPASVTGILTSIMPRVFTREEAEGTLPEIVSLLWKLRSLKPRYDEAAGGLAAAGKGSQANGHAVDIDIARASAEQQRVAAEMQALVSRINEMGAEVKDIDAGLIDFRAIVAGREVYLCWKMGEERIEWWHDLDSGFASRQRLD